MIGDRFFGWRGAFAALAGMLALPLVIVLVLAALYAHFAAEPQVAGALRGMGAVAAGLIIRDGAQAAAHAGAQPARPRALRCWRWRPRWPSSACCAGRWPTRCSASAARLVAGAAVRGACGAQRAHERLLRSPADWLGAVRALPGRCRCWRSAARSRPHRTCTATSSSSGTGSTTASSAPRSRWPRRRPGPNLLFVPVIGYARRRPGRRVRRAGRHPAAEHDAGAGRDALGQQAARQRGVRAFVAGMAPLTIGLLLSTGWPAGPADWCALPAAWLLVAATVVLSVKTKVNPVWLIAGGAAARRARLGLSRHSASRCAPVAAGAAPRTGRRRRRPRRSGSRPRRASGCAPVRRRSCASSWRRPLPSAPSTSADRAG